MTFSDVIGVVLSAFGSGLGIGALYGAVANVIRSLADG
jgi:hypothetical protein